jgi:flavodoxin I
MRAPKFPPPSFVLAALLLCQQALRVQGWVSGAPRGGGSWLTTSPVATTTTTTTSLGAAVGILFGSCTGGTQECADKIHKAFGSGVAAEPIDIDSLASPEDVAAVFAEHKALVVGAPTWNTGSETERSGTGWDSLYYSSFPDFKSVLAGKKVAVFGLGDQVSYADYFCDAAGELHDAFEGMGCAMLGFWNMDGYEHEASESVRGDKFCGLLLDEVNQDDLTDDRIKGWVTQLKEEGILKG